MPLFKKKPTKDELEERGEYLQAQTEVASREAELAEKEAIKKELKRKYGSSWKSILGLKGKLDLSTLRSILSDMGKGLHKMGSATSNPRLDPRPSRRR